MVAPASRGRELYITLYSRKGRGKNEKGERAAPYPFTGCDHLQGVIPPGPVQGCVEYKLLNFHFKNGWG